MHSIDLILWDIDGTITRGGPAVLHAYDSALRASYKLEGEIARISYAGKTDPQITLETLSHHAIDEEQGLLQLEHFRERYTQELEQRLPQLREQLSVHPGVPELLEALRQRGIAQTLLTGNFEATARLKLQAVGLEHYFSFAAGAFGSDHHDRNCFVPIALEKARGHYQRAFEPARVLVIGDTERDIACARAGGVKVLAVASGTVGPEQLAAHQPNALLPNLGDHQQALELILGL